MVIIGEIITTLRKRNNMSQSDLAKKLNASRDIISKYERGLNTPSLEMAQKIANVFEVTVDFLLGKGTFAKYDKEAIKRLEDIENLDSNTRNILFGVIDTFLRDAKARQAYGG
jgi:transcriptional regulator with XRE-family HTH domain